MLAPPGSLLTRAARADLYGDAVNEALLMRPGQWLTRLLVFFDNRVVDGAVNGSAAMIGGLSSRSRRWQTGFARSYALSMLGGAVLVGAALVLVSCDDDVFPWLTLIAVVPLVGAVVLLVLPTAATCWPSRSRWCSRWRRSC